MEQAKIANQMIKFQKSLFDNSFKAMQMVQDQTEQMTGAFIEQLPWANDDTRKAVNESIEFYKKARDDFKKAVDDGFGKLDDMFGAE